ncbi:MAG: MMPL family transporter [Rubrivivax sp.]
MNHASTATAAISRPPRWVLLLWAVAVALAVLQILRTNFVADLSAFLPATTDQQQRVLIDQIRSGTPARTLMLGIDDGSPAARVAASKAVAAQLRDSGLFEQVSNGEHDAWADVGRWLFDRRYLLSPATTPEHFTPAGLREGFQDTLSLLGTPAGALVKPLLNQDPTGETQRIAESMIPVQSPRTEQGVWVAREAPRALLMASTRAAGADLDGQAAAIAAVHQAFERFKQQPGPGLSAADLQGLTLQVSGAPTFAVESRAQIQSEVEWLSISGTLVMSALLLLAFASPLALGVALLPVATGVLAGIAAVSLGFGNVHGVTLGFGSTLIGEAVDYAIYYMIQARRGTTGGTAAAGWQHWLRSGWPTIRLGLLTSVCGFVALLFSGFPGLQQLGVFSIAGLLAAAFTTRWLMPVLMPDGAQGQGLRRQLGQLARVMVQVLPRTKVMWMVLGALAVGVLLTRTQLWSAELSSLSPVPKAKLELEAALRGEMGSSDNGALVVVQAADPETLLQRAEAAAARLDTLVNNGQLAGFNSITRFVPSLATQRARQAALPDEATLQTALAQATQGGPFKAERLQPFVQAVAQARSAPLDTLDTARQSALRPLVSALVLQAEDGRWSTLLPLQATGAEGVPLAAVKTALQGLPDTRVLDIGGELGGLYARYLGEARDQAALGALGVLLIMAVAVRRPRRILAVCQPLLLAVLLTLGGLAALGVQLGILHLIGLLLVVAVGSNYALFFDLLREHPDDSDDTLASLLLANLTTVLGFGLIALSSIPALSAIGRVVGPGALLALLLSAAFIAPAARKPATGAHA